MEKIRKKNVSRQTLYKYSSKERLEKVRERDRNYKRKKRLSLKRKHEIPRLPNQP